MDLAKDIDKPFQVQASTGVIATSGFFVAGHDTEEAAKVDADRRNERAETLDVKTRYVVFVKEQSAN